MPIINRFHDLYEDISAWRRDFHAHPELLFDLHRTAGIVAEKLKAFGVDHIETGIAQTGIVALIKGKSNTSGKTIGLRADMDALPIQEIPNLPHKSKIASKMHACGHDGHTSMLLGAAQYLAETRNFDGTVALIFQPAEEGGGGGKVMVDEGIMERFGISQVYGLHNYPGLPAGHFAINTGPMMAATDFFTIDIVAKGGHAAQPHNANDPAMIVAQIVQGFQTIVSRNVDPLKNLVISTTQIHMGDADNVIAQTARLRGTVRTLDPEIQTLAVKRMGEICEGAGLAFAAEVTFNYRYGYPVTVNHEAEAEFASQVAEAVVGSQNMVLNVAPMMAAEDFSYMLNARPGAYIFLGQGDTAGLHHPEYDFNDEIIPAGCSYLAKLVEESMPLAS